jgi:DNA-binding NtrC family response regulator
VPTKRVWVRACPGLESFESDVRAAMIASGIEIETDCNGPYGVICFDLPGEPVLAALREARRDPLLRALAVSARAPIDSGTVWRLLHAGATDVLSWSEHGAIQVTAKLQRWFEVDELTRQVTSQESLVGDSPQWQVTVRRIVEAARFSTVPVLLTGQSGTGKELLARLISAAGATASGMNKFRKELVTVDCAALVPELSGSEFFGHERGAFTGAHMQREGAFALADGATLLLDEIGEVPPGLQAQLLRAIQEKTYKRVGGNVWQKTDFRLVCATNRDLEELVGRGQFRLDLYYRIAGCVFRTPSLEERKEDILPLARHFLSGCLSGPPPKLDGAVCEYLLNRQYRGNIRELRRLIERIAHRHAGPGAVTAGDVPEDDRPAGEIPRAWPDAELERSIANALAVGASLKEITQAATEAAIRIAVQSEKNNLQRAAGKLGITDRALQMRRAAGRLGE